MHYHYTLPLPHLCGLIYDKLSFSVSILSINIDKFYLNLVLEFILGRRGLGCEMGKFHQISAELWPLIIANIWFPLSTLRICRPIFFEKEFKFGSSGMVLYTGKFCQIKYRFTSLSFAKIFKLVLYSMASR